MADMFSAAADALFSVNDNAQAQRSQVALYAMNKAATYWSANKTDEAITEFKKVLAFDPQNTDAYASLGKICTAVGRPEEAKSFYRRALEIEPWNAGVRNALQGLI